jgi:NAD(P)H-flavin reductase
VVLRVDDPDGPAPAPGQFHMLATVERWGGGEDERPFLPRAIAPVVADDGRLVFVLHDVGPGTHRLEALAPGEELWLNGPLGRGFTPGPGTPILVAGGIGVPPVASWLPHAPGAIVLAGFRDAHHAELAALLSGPPAAAIATDDGSLGHDGYVTELLRAALDDHAAATVYACGPPPMLEAVRAMCVERGVPAQLALESPMACGFGACFGCVVPLAGGGYARTCVDGPVMDAAVLAEIPFPRSEVHSA